MTGTILSHYRIASAIGTGGMGEVYLAEDTRLERKVAIKILPAELVKDERRLQRFEQEARAVSALNHPNIITLHEIGQTDEAHFIVTEFIEGETLRERLARAPMELLDILDVAIQTANALVAAHNAGIIHRDIKPDNLMLRPDGYVKVLDFGIAKLSEKSSTQELITVESENTQIRTPIRTEPGIVMGSPHYMSPEQARGKPVDERTDIFSLGVMLYEMIAGTRPFVGETVSDLIAEILTKEPPPLSAYLPGVPTRLEALTRRALAKKLDERVATMSEMVAELRRVKRRLEFDSGLDLSAPPDLSRPTSETTQGATNGAATDRSQARETLEMSATSSINHEQTTTLDLQTVRVRRHAKTYRLAAVALLALLAALAYWYLAGGVTARQIQSLAVMPLAHNRGDANTEYLADGLTESLINNLARATTLKVMSRNSVFHYKDLPFDLRDVRQRLGVDVVLSGSLAQRGDQLLVSVELIDARDNSRIWGEQYSRRTADLLTLHQEIAAQVSQALGLQSAAGVEKAQALQPGTGSFEAYELYLRGRFHWNKRTSEAMQRGLEYFQQAIDKDPRYALAYVGLADAYALLGEYETIPAREAVPKAKAAALKALELDDQLAEAHTSLAAVYEYEWEWAAAEREYRAAIEKNPKYEMAHHWYGILLSNLGRHAEAEAALKKALALDPVSLIVNTALGKAYSDARRYDEAVGQLQRTLEMQPDFGEAHFQLAMAQEGRGDYDGAIRSIERAAELDRNANLRGWVAREYALAGKGDEARRVIETLAASAKPQALTPYLRATVAAALGEREVMYEWLERIYAERSYYAVLLKVDPVFDSFRQEARFQDLLARVGLPR